MYNKVTLVGHLGKDPETRNGPDGSVIVNVSLATQESWKSKATGEKEEKTEWHKLVFFGRLAEVAAEYLRKGALILVVGRLQTRKWQNKEGVDQYTTEVVVQDMKMMPKGQSSGSRQDASEYADADYGQPAAAARSQPARQQAPVQQRRAAMGGGGATPPDDFDDDIPFIHPWGVL